MEQRSLRNDPKYKEMVEFLDELLESPYQFAGALAQLRKIHIDHQLEVADLMAQLDSKTASESNSEPTMTMTFTKEQLDNLDGITSAPWHGEVDRLIYTRDFLGAFLIIREYRSGATPVTIYNHLKEYSKKYGRFWMLISQRELRDSVTRRDWLQAIYDEVEGKRCLNAGSLLPGEKPRQSLCKPEIHASSLMPERSFEGEYPEDFRSAYSEDLKPDYLHERADLDLSLRFKDDPPIRISRGSLESYIRFLDNSSTKGPEVLDRGWGNKTRR